MGATLTTVDSVLKIFYDGPIRDQLAHEVLCLELFERSKKKWSGKSVYVPVKLGRNDTVFVAAEGATFSTTINQETLGDLTITRKNLYGRIQFTGQVLANLTNDQDSFIDRTALQVDGMVDSIRDRANQYLFDGGKIIGFVHQRQNGANGTTVSWQFDGRLDYVQGLVDQCDAAGLKPHVKFIRLDTYEYVGNECRITGTSSATHTLTILHTTSAGADGSVDTRIATLTTLGVGIPFALEITAGTLLAAQNLGLGGLTTLIGATGVLPNQPTGIYTQLAARNHFVDESGSAAMRNTGGTYAILQSTIRTVAVGSTDNNYVFSALNPIRLQALKTKIGTTSGKDPDVIFCHPDARMAYTAAAIGAGGSHLHVNVGEGGAKKKLDLGVSNSAFTYEDLRWISSRHCGQSMFIFLNTSTWKVYENMAPKWADETGSIIEHVPNSDVFVGMYKWYWELFCDQPNANGILVGFSFGDMVS